ncbi:MAG: methyltransferase domain-containing protein [Peptococcaceae bacterium]|jgi:predicted methyltransferase|nr:methyltransferase domain-containing protein [Peptococcaceae bacterium]
MINGIQNIQKNIRLFLTAVIQSGDTVLDATAGRGRDTQFLAERVGPRGTVHAFDIQAEALADTRKLLREQELERIVQLHRRDHAALAQVVRAPLRAAMFNLGYLPGGDQAIVTQAATTVEALRAATGLLLPGGIVSLTVYRGHPGALEEEAAVRTFIHGLPESFSVLEGRYPALPEHTPYWILLQKKEGGE